MIDSSDPSFPPRLHACFNRHPHLRPVSERHYLPDGWDAPIADAVGSLAQLSRETGVAVKLLQVKQKFGTLRVHMVLDEALSRSADGDPPWRRRIGQVDSEPPGSVRQRAALIVANAWARCEVTCEVCGAPGVNRLDADVTDMTFIACDRHG